MTIKQQGGIFGTTANPSAVPVSAIVDDGGDLCISITYIEA